MTVAVSRGKGRYRKHGCHDGSRNAQGSHSDLPFGLFPTFDGSRGRGPDREAAVRIV
jgi:hypothetical protein